MFDPRRCERVAAFAPPPDRRFAGHGAFSAEGHLLFAAENDFDAERGVLGIYDATDGFVRLGEFPTFGIGPHEVLLLSDGKTLAVANGGISTHPDFPRAKLNIATMKPSLALIRSTDGACLASVRLHDDWHKLSIRHIAERASGEIWFGAQYEGPSADAPPLVGTFDERKGVSLIAAPSAHARLSQYVGSVAASRDGSTVVTTSPRGGVALEWDAVSRTVRNIHAIVDVCGAAPVGSGSHLLTAGTGAVVSGDQAPSFAQLAWDNHVTAL